MLLKQLASFFLCWQLDQRAFSPNYRQTDGRFPIGLQCTKQRCREFLMCTVPSKATCSCFLRREMKSFSCHRRYFMVSESGNSDLHEATRFYCQRSSYRVEMTLSGPTEHLTNVIVIGILEDYGDPAIYFDNNDCRSYNMHIQFNPKENFTIDKGKPAKTFPFIVGKVFEMELTFRQNEYEVNVDGKIIFSMTASPWCSIQNRQHLHLIGLSEIRSVHFSYTK